MNDDDFYNFAPHIDKKLRRKIENGRYVDLAKLIKRNKSVANRNENGVELINREGHSYLISVSIRDAPVINCFRRWEQAFHVYAGIFTQANPHRGHELY